MEEKEETLEELKKKNERLTEALKKREEQLEFNSSVIADFNSKNLNLHEEIQKCSDLITELQSKCGKKVR